MAKNAGNTNARAFSDEIEDYIYECVRIGIPVDNVARAFKSVSVRTICNIVKRVEARKESENAIRNNA